MTVGGLEALAGAHGYGLRSVTTRFFGRPRYIYTVLGGHGTAGSAYKVKITPPLTPPGKWSERAP